MEFLKTSLNHPLKFVLGGQFISEVPWLHQERIVDSFEVIIGLSETLYIQIDEQYYEVNAGDFLVLFPYQRHQGYQISSPQISFYWFHFYCPGFYEILNERMKKEDLINAAVENNLVIPRYLKLINPSRMNILAQQLLHVGNSDYHLKQAADYSVTALMIELSEQFLSGMKLSDFPQDDHNFQKMTAWIRMHALDHHMSVERIANEFKYNKDYLSRLFKQRKEVNLLTYIHQLKLETAKDYLTRTSLSVKEIADKVGINDPKQFMKLFKRYEAITPTQYRRAFTGTFLNNM
jgi:AraC-like DNA-binding protein